MAKKSNRDLYDDEDEIDKSLREFQKGQAAGQSEEQEGDVKEEATEEQTPKKVEAPVVHRPTRRPVPSVTVKNKNDKPDEVVLEGVVCDCCKAPWMVSTKDDTLRRSSCGCAIHPTCNMCHKCGGHCECRMQVFGKPKAVTHAS